MRHRHQKWPVAVALILGTVTATAIGQLIGTAQCNAAYAAPAVATPAPPAAPVQQPAAPPSTPPAAVHPSPTVIQSPPTPPPAPYSPPPAPVKRGPAPPGVAAIVNGEKIPLSKVSAMALKVAGEDVLHEIISTTLVEQAAAKAGVSATPAEVAERVLEARQDIARQIQGQSLESLLAANHRTVQEFTDSMKIRLDAEKLVSKNLVPATLVHARHLLVATRSLGQDSSVPVRTDAEALAIIAKAQADLKAGKSWTEVVKTYSDDAANKDNSGDLGILFPNAPYDKTFLAAALTLKAGQISDPVKSVFGYHLIQAVSTSALPPTTEQASYAQAEKSYLQQQYQQLIPALLQKLQNDAKITDYLAP